MTYMGLGVSAFPAIEAKTASYTVTPEDQGKIFTNRGASGAVTLTLPPVAKVQAGWSIRFMCLVDENLVISAPADKLSAFNDATATSLTIGQTGEQIGVGGEVIFDGTTYLLFVNSPAEAVTLTYA